MKTHQEYPMTALRRLALIIVLILLAGAGATPALAGSYAVYACEPSHEVDHSWFGETHGAGLSTFPVCPPAIGAPKWNAGIIARATAPTVATGSWAAMTFRAPPGASLYSITYKHAFCGAVGFKAGLMNAAGTWLHYSGPLQCGTWVLDQPNTVILGGTSAVRLMIQCVQGPCTATESVGYAAMRSATVVVVDNTTPSLTITGGSAVTPGWKRGAISVTYSAVDNVGVAYVDVQASGQARAANAPACDWTRPAPCPNQANTLAFDTHVLSDGSQALSLRAMDAAGNWSTKSIAVGVDNSAPGPPIGLSEANGVGWRSANSFSLGWRNPAQSGTAPIVAAHYAICRGDSAPNEWTGCTFAEKVQPDVNHLTGLTVPRAGEWVARVWLRDAAGNQMPDTAQTVPLRFDNTPPAVGFGPADQNDPTRIDVRASDPTSPISRVEVEIRRRGEARWLPIPTTPSTHGFSARLDDEHLADGVYDLRARAVDSAGNERSSDRETSGRIATRPVPARINTHLVAGQIKRVSARRANGKRRTRRIIVVRPKVNFGRTIPIRGRLTTPGANPVANAGVEVWERTLIAGAQSHRIALIGTDRKGRFKFKALRGPSRVLLFRYPGTPLIRARTTEVEVHVRATTSFETSRHAVVNGDEIVLRGRVRGRLLPTVGKLVQLQAYSRGRWLTFATPRANPRSGRWSYRYRFTSTRGTVRYRFRARVPREAGFPYSAGTSRFAFVTVRGL